MSLEHERVQSVPKVGLKVRAENSDSEPGDGDGVTGSSLVARARSDEGDQRFTHADLLEPIEKESYYPSGAHCRVARL